jgi:hypothetical protein
MQRIVRFIDSLSFNNFRVLRFGDNDARPDLFGRSRTDVIPSKKLRRPIGARFGQLLEIQDGRRNDRLAPEFSAPTRIPRRSISSGGGG